jgi:hypothetical protein
LSTVIRSPVKFLPNFRYGASRAALACVIKRSSNRSRI